MNTVLRTAPNPGVASLPWRTTALSLAAVAVYMALGPAPEQLVFDRAAIAQGEWWRLLTAHWVHGDNGHAAWDIVMLAVLGGLFEPRLAGKLPWVLLFGSLAVDAWLWWGEPSLRYYCGLSGILNTLLVVGLLQLWRDRRQPLILWVLGLSAIKVAFEIAQGQAVLTRTVWPSVPTTHAAGMICGLLLAVLGSRCPEWLRRTRNRRNFSTDSISSARVHQ
jgi:rhomboid family GlyGly-CTERM serine protease